jgi:2-oxoisovalerate dehydrogenase E1 component alpha subunit
LAERQRPRSGECEGMAAVKDDQARHVALGLDTARLHDMYEKLLTARFLDERMWILNRQGKVAFVISCQGQEACQVGTAYALDAETDFILPYYRDLGVVLVRGQTPLEILLAVYGKRDDPSSAGRQMPAHFSSRRLRLITPSSVVATQIPHCAGIALSIKLQRQRGLAITYFGEGSTSQGDFHEGLNFAAVRKLPCIFVCENNQYAITEPQNRQMAIADVAIRAAGYGMPGVIVDGNDVLEVYRVTREAADRARNGDGPTLIEAKTYRLVPHSSDDNERRYRTSEEVENWRRRDPIDRFKAYLVGNGLLDEDTDQEIRARVRGVIQEAADAAERAPGPTAADLLSHVYAGGTA